MHIAVLNDISLQAYDISQSVTTTITELVDSHESIIVAENILLDGSLQFVDRIGCRHRHANIGTYQFQYDRA